MSEAADIRRFLVDLMPRLGMMARKGFEDPGPVIYKRPGNPVTEIDRAIEDEARRAIQDAWPDHAIQGEERGASEGTAPYRWFIDPIDGTMNFIRGIPFFSVSIGVTRGETVVAGAVLDPLRNELFHAARDEGARLGDAPIAIGGAVKLADAAVSMQTNASGELLKRNEFMLDLHRQTQKTRKLGTIALELAYVACGRLDLLVAGKGRPQAWWDIAGGWALVVAAGGVVTDLEGRPLTEASTHLAAGSEPLVTALIELFG
ncbi:MAG: inositol monophosphatase family protein [Planctomycetota bacterium]|jgi:myo-inositol-1(or 4)-monophosphatase